MKKTLILVALLFSTVAVAQIATKQGGTGNTSPGLTAGSKISITGTWPNQTITSTGAAAGANSDITSLTGLSTPLSVAQGGTGTTTPALVAGTGVTITGTWPAQTITATGATGYVPGVDAASVCVGGSYGTYGVDPTGAHDSTSALNLCLTNYPSVALRAGSYITSGAISIPSGGTLTGAGIGATSITSSSTSSNVITLASGGVRQTVSGLKVAHSGTPASGGNGVGTALGVSLAVSQATIRDVYAYNNYDGFSLGPTDFSICDHCIVEQGKGHGFDFVGTASGSNTPLQWVLQNTLAQFNSGYGYYVNGNGNTNAIVGQAWYNAESFANTLGGFYFYNGSGAVNDIMLVHPVSSSDCGDGIAINSSTNSYNNSINGGLIEYAGGLAGIKCGYGGPGSGTSPTGAGNGINLVALKDILITGTKISYNGYFGIYLQSAANITLTGNRIFDNSATTSGTYSGIATAAGASGSYVSITGNDFTSLAGASSTQKNNIVTSAGTNANIIGNNAVTAVAGGSGCLLAGTTKPAGGAVAYNFGSSCP